MIKSREFLNAFSGKPVKKKTVQKLQEAHKEGLIEGTFESPEFQRFLGEVDFNLLRSLFEELIKKTELSVREINFLGADKIINHQILPNLNAAYDILSN